MGYPFLKHLIDSLIVLAMPWSSHPYYFEIILGGGVACVNGMAMYRRGLL